MRNYLLTLGWGPKDGEEIRPIAEFIEVFELSDINKSPAFFDLKKLEHFQREYVRAMSVDDFIAWSSSHAGEIDADLYRRLAPEVQGRVTLPSDVPGLLDWVVGDAPEPSEKDWKKVMSKDGVAAVLDAVIERCETCEWTPDALEEVVFGVGRDLDAKTQLPVRMAVSGSRSGLPLFEPMAALDRAVALERLRSARSRL